MKAISVLFFLFFALNSYAQLNPATKKLHYFMQEMSWANLIGKNLKKYTFKEFKRLIEEEKADPHAFMQTGANALHFAIESWAYQSRAADPYLKDLNFKIIKYLIELKADASIIDYRGLSGIYYIYRFGPGHEKSKELVKILLKNGANLNTVAPNGWHLVHGLTRLKLNQVNDLVKWGMNILAIDKDGQGAGHLFASNNLFYKLSEYFSEDIIEKLANQKMSNGMMPIHFAATNKKIESFKYLVEIQKSDPELKTDTDHNALDYAKLVGSEEIIGYLKELGTQAAAQEHISCEAGKNFFEPNFEIVVELINKCRIKSIEMLLSLMPKRYMANYIKSYFSHAVQNASGAYPLITVTGPDATFMMNFNGHPSQRGYKNLEIIQFRRAPGNKHFELRDIIFPESEKGEVIISEKNPTACIGCHGVNPKPLWDSWTFWPGKFFSDAQTFSPNEKKYFDAFKPNRNFGRYKYLAELSYTPQKNIYGYSASNHNFRNNHTDDLIEMLMGEKVASDMGQYLSHIRYELLAALSCKQPVTDFFTEEQIKNHDLNLKSLERLTREALKREVKNRTDLQERLVGEIQGRYTLITKLFNHYDNNIIQGRSSGFKRTTNIRYIVENLSQFDLSAWFTPYNNGLESFMTQEWGLVEFFAWKELLDPKKDDELYKLYQARYNKVKSSGGLGFWSNLFYGGESENVCNLLKKKISL